MQFKRSKRSRSRGAKKTAGRGSKKKTRNSGHRGGAGNAGSGKRGSAKNMKVNNGETVFGKHGFISVTKKVKAISLDTLQSRLAGFVSEKKAEKQKDEYSVDLAALGYGKLLSKGKIRFKMNIKVGSATENAIAKVESAGGKMELTQKQDTEEHK